MSNNGYVGIRNVPYSRMSREEKLTYKCIMLTLGAARHFKYYSRFVYMRNSIDIQHINAEAQMLLDRDAIQAELRGDRY